MRSSTEQIEQRRKQKNFMLIKLLSMKYTHTHTHTHTHINKTFSAGNGRFQGCFFFHTDDLQICGKLHDVRFMSCLIFL